MEDGATKQHNLSRENFLGPVIYRHRTVNTESWGWGAAWLAGRSHVTFWCTEPRPLPIARSEGLACHHVLVLHGSVMASEVRSEMLRDIGGEQSVSRAVACLRDWEGGSGQGCPGVTYHQVRAIVWSPKGMRPLRAGETGLQYHIRLPCEG